MPTRGNHGQTCLAMQKYTQADQRIGRARAVPIAITSATLSHIARRLLAINFSITIATPSPRTAGDGSGEFTFRHLQENIISEQILSFLRTLVQSAAGALAAKGFIDASGELVIVAFVMWAIPTAWSLYVRRKAGLVASAAVLPEVTKIVTTADIATTVDDPAVTTR
ncbi:hypothetical protein B5U99_00875 [Bosea sp. Tri-54]|nr:hypothetical protein B5U99_00875 [Bosea sp. Tri-54]